MRLRLVSIFLLGFAYGVMVFYFVTVAVGAEIRNPAQVRAFRKANPCPVTQKTTGACPGFVVDHIVPLCFGGGDLPSNMTWQEVRASYKKDVFERQACALKKKVADGKLNE